MSDWFLFVLLTFASYRVTQLLVYDDGPFDLILKFRVAVGVYDRNEAGETQNPVAKLFSCPYCMGLWISFFAALVSYLYGHNLFIWWIAIGGSQSFLESRGYANSR